VKKKQSEIREKKKTEGTKENYGEGITQKSPLSMHTLSAIANEEGGRENQ